MFGIGNCYQFHIVALRRIRSLSLSLSLSVYEYCSCYRMVFRTIRCLSPTFCVFLCLSPPFSLSLFLSLSLSIEYYTRSLTLYIFAAFSDSLFLSFFIVLLVTQLFCVISSYPNGKNLDGSKFKGFADNKLNITGRIVFVFDEGKNFGKRRKCKSADIYSFSHYVFKSRLLQNSGLCCNGLS